MPCSYTVWRVWPKNNNMHFFVTSGVKYTITDTTRQHHVNHQHIYVGLTNIVRWKPIHLNLTYMSMRVWLWSFLYLCIFVQHLENQSAPSTLIPYTVMETKQKVKEVKNIGNSRTREVDVKVTKLTWFPFQKHVACQVPSYKFVPLVYQLAVHLGALGNELLRQVRNLCIQGENWAWCRGCTCLCWSSKLWKGWCCPRYDSFQECSDRCSQWTRCSMELFSSWWLNLKKNDRYGFSYNCGRQMISVPRGCRCSMWNTKTTILIRVTCMHNVGGLIICITCFVAM